MAISNINKLKANVNNGNTTSVSSTSTKSNVEQFASDVLTYLRSAKLYFVTEVNPDIIRSLGVKYNVMGAQDSVLTEIDNQKSVILLPKLDSAITFDVSSQGYQIFDSKVFVDAREVQSNRMSELGSYTLKHTTLQVGNTTYTLQDIFTQLSYIDSRFGPDRLQDIMYIGITNGVNRFKFVFRYDTYTVDVNTFEYLVTKTKLSSNSSPAFTKYFLKNKEIDETYNLQLQMAIQNLETVKASTPNNKMAIQAAEDMVSNVKKNEPDKNALRITKISLKDYQYDLRRLKEKYATLKDIYINPRW